MYVVFIQGKKIGLPLQSSHSRQSVYFKPNNLIEIPCYRTLQRNVIAIPTWQALYVNRKITLWELQRIFSYFSITRRSINIHYQKSGKKGVYETLTNFVEDLFLCSVWWNNRFCLFTEVIFIPFIIIRRRRYRRRHFHWCFSSGKQFGFFFVLFWVDRFRLIKYWFG